MKNILLALFICAFPLSVFAKEGFNSAMECYYTDRGVDYFYFCGNQSSTCMGAKYNNNDKRTNHRYGDHFNAEGQNKYCCPREGKSAGDLHSESGVYVNSMAKKETITVQLATGTCDYQKITDVCGTVTSDVPCTKPSTCDAGYEMRNGTCSKMCEDGKVYQSATSNACVDCETSLHGGVNAAGDICIKCSEGSEFYSSATKSCVTKSSMATYSMDVMKKCGLCKDADFKKCIDLFKKTESEIKTDAAYNAIKTACLITE
jgi:hypothetical protein